VLLETYQQGLLAVAGGPLAWFASREAQEWYNYSPGGTHLGAVVMPRQKPVSAGQQGGEIVRLMIESGGG
jgi:hypothetical protein